MSTKLCVYTWRMRQSRTALVTQLLSSRGWPGETRRGHRPKPLLEFLVHDDHEIASMDMVLCVCVCVCKNCILYSIHNDRLCVDVCVTSGLRITHRQCMYMIFIDIIHSFTLKTSSLIL